MQLSCRNLFSTLNICACRQIGSDSCLMWLFPFHLDYSSFYAQIPATCACHPQRLWGRSFPHQACPFWGGSEGVLLPRNSLHHCHRLPESAGIVSSSPLARFLLSILLYPNVRNYYKTFALHDAHSVCMCAHRDNP